MVSAITKKRFARSSNPNTRKFYETDLKVVTKAIAFAEDWNEMCQDGNEILITSGDVWTIDGEQCLVEPFIRNFEKFTSNNGWIADEDDVGSNVLIMEAFTHYTYHRSGGQMIVCDLQGRYRDDAYRCDRCRFELTDPAICSRRRNYGVTDLGEKGIESFFANHYCNEYCNFDGYWARPQKASSWFRTSSATTMIRSSAKDLLFAGNPHRFNNGMSTVYDDDDEEYW